MSPWPSNTISTSLRYSPLSPPSQCLGPAGGLYLSSLLQDVSMFAEGRGSEVIYGVADYWVSRASWNPEDKKYHLLGERNRTRRMHFKYTIKRSIILQKLNLRTSDLSLTNHAKCKVTAMSFFSQFTFVLYRYYFIYYFIIFYLHLYAHKLLKRIIQINVVTVLTHNYCIFIYSSLINSKVNSIKVSSFPFRCHAT